MHISELKNPTAGKIVVADLDANLYHQNIQAAAFALCSLYSSIEWIYLTQWASGTTLWADKTNRSHTITIEGKTDSLTRFLKDYAWEILSAETQEKIVDLLTKQEVKYELG